MSSAPAWMTEGASAVRKHQIERDYAAQSRRRAERTMEANNLMVGQLCADILGGSRK